LDKKTLNAWAQHPRLNIIPNVEGESFEDKINRVVVAVEKITGNSSENIVNLRYKLISAKLPANILTRHSKVYEVPLINKDTDKYLF